MKRSCFPLNNIIEDLYMSFSRDGYPSLLHHISASEYTSLSAEQKRLIRTTQFIIPKVGAQNFGKFRIQLKHPMTKAQFLKYGTKQK